jgi:serine/threonine-protein phosphatase 2A regulatory subunit B
MNWLHPQGRYLKLVTSNARTIKLWKMFEKAEKKVVKSAGKELCMPKLQTIECSYVAEPQKLFPSRHISAINAVSVAKSEEYLLSSDEGQVFLWSLEKPDKPFMLANYAPKTEAEEQKELVTCS